MVREGYKQTEIGVIPEDWELKTIGDIGSVSSGGTPSRNILSYWNGNIPWITTTQIDFKTIKNAEQFITKDGLNNSAANLFDPGTLLMAMYGQGKTRGKVAILGVKASTNQACAAILLSEKVDRNYVFHYLVSQYEVIRTLSNTGNQENLNGLIIKSIKIPFPPLPEQRAIAQALSDVDALIAALDKLIAKKRDLKTATMQQLLTGKKRLPGFDGEWETINFGTLADKKDKWSITGGPFGSNLKSIDYTEQGIRIIQLQNIGDGQFLNDYQIFTSVEKADELEACNIYPGEIILSKMGDPVARACIIPNHSPRYLMCSDGIRLKIDLERHDVSFIHTYINSPYFRKQAIEASTGSTRQRIGLSDLKKIPLILPGVEEQRKIGTVLSDMDNAIALLESRLTKTQAIKQGMMQELLRGRTRLI